MIYGSYIEYLRRSSVTEGHNLHQVYRGIDKNTKDKETTIDGIPSSNR